MKGHQGAQTLEHPEVVISEVRRLAKADFHIHFAPTAGSTGCRHLGNGDGDRYFHAHFGQLPVRVADGHGGNGGGGGCPLRRPPLPDAHRALIMLTSVTGRAFKRLWRESKKGP